MCSCMYQYHAVIIIFIIILRVKCFLKFYVKMWFFVFTVHVTVCLQYGNWTEQICSCEAMSQWQALICLCQSSLQMRERISELYRRIHFPYRFRSQFAEWIEAQNWYVSVKFIIMKRVINSSNTYSVLLCMWGKWIYAPNSTNYVQCCWRLCTFASCAQIMHTIFSALC